MVRRFGFLASLILFLCCARPASAQGASDTLTAQAPEQRLRMRPEDADLWLRTGHTRLKAGDLKGAEKAFKKALFTGGKESAARAYNGLGLVYAAYPGQLQTAIYYFQEALSRDPRYVEALTNKAQTYFSHNWLSQAIQAAEKAVAVDSTHAPARQLLAKCRERKAEEERRAREALEGVLKSEPEDSSGWMAWGKNALSGKAYEEILRRLPGLIQAHPGWRELLPILAQACWKGSLTQKAWEAFQAYAEGLSERERMLYEDIRLVSSKDMADRYEQASGEGRSALARRFWAERDPDLTTPVNERLLEHYRRVWYARSHFSARKFPWDRRGEVYIRYGEPDYRSRSGDVSPPPTAAANAVKERFFNAIYDDMQAVFAMGGGSETRDVETGVNTGTMIGVQWFDAVTGALTGSIVGPVFPIRSSTTYGPNETGGVYLPIGPTDFSAVAWESWVYADIDGGIVVDFTDEIGRGAFDYAPIPELGKTPGLRNQTLDAVRALAALARRSPKVIVETAAAAVPERYEVPLDERPLGFYYDAATFRGRGDSIGVEVYYGVPMSEATCFQADQTTGLRAICRMALADDRRGVVYRTEAELSYLEEGDRTRATGFIPHVARLDVPPGEYRLDVRVENRLNGRVGYYRNHLTVDPYPAGPLKLSDVELAWKITEGGGQDRFSKSGLRVVPIPTRLYKKGQPVWLYYEVYNLRRDEAGRTDYTVDYTIRSGSPPGLVSRIARAFQGSGQQVSLVQAQLGAREVEVNRMELDLSACAPGEIVVNVAVRDLISGQTASKEATFVIKE